MYNEKLNISDLSMGISSGGMERYKEDLKADILLKTIELINSVDPIVTKINDAWQGKSRDKFLEDFRESRELICEDLKLEYEDLSNRLEELKSNYFEIDQKLMM